MAFVNEIAAEADIENYRLDDLKKEIDPFSWSNGRPEGFIHAWTIDRERDIALVLGKMVEETGPSGRPEPTSRHVFSLCFGQRRVLLLLDRTYCSRSFSDNPFQLTWKLLEIGGPHSAQIGRDFVVKVLKEALAAYGYRGAHRQVANTVVELNA